LFYNLRVESKLLALSAWPLLPLLAMQGLRTRRRTPRLPDAAGPLTGLLDGSGKELCLLALGDSVVAGVGAADHVQGLAGQSARALRAQTGRPVRWHAAGRTGATAARVCRELLPRVAKLPADVIVVSVGVNDVKNLHTQAQWRRNMSLLLDGLQENFGPVPTILLGVPQMSHFPTLPQPLRAILGARAALFNETDATLAATRPHVHHLLMSRPPAQEEFARDGFHPGPSGYAVIGALVGATAAPLV
jgi:lysophospholipase L1-like esterase